MSSLLRHSILLLALMLCGVIASAQLPYFFNEGRAGVQFGVSTSIGSRLNRLGVFAEGYYLVHDRFQLGASLRGYQVLNGYGPQGQRGEFQASLAGLVGFGKNKELKAPFFSYVSNYTQGEGFLAYSLNVYLDNVETSQVTATLGLGHGGLFLWLENDALADGIRDRFRTATFLLGYENEDTRFAINSLMWTGDPSSKGRTNIAAKDYPGRYGAVNLEKAKHGDCSHGILSLQVQRRIAGNQIMRLDLGIDAEQIRHALQNRLIHDAIIIPSWLFNIKNRHVPMLDSQGKPYLFKEDQKIRKALPFGMLSLNPGLFW
ncbi:MAG: polymorphic toxin type 23 domain-containing protein [Bacteroidia bacterium]